MTSLKNIVTGTWLGKLYAKNRLLCLCVFGFFFISVSANLFLRLETTPFFLWNMYSPKAAPQSDYTVYEVRADGKLLNIPHTWEDPGKMLLFDPLQYYVEVQLDQGGKDPFRDYMDGYWGVKHPRFRGILSRLYNTPAQFRAFPGWYKRYLSQQAGDTVREIAVIRKKVDFTENAELRLLAADTVMIIR
jgi:hypothetical protein